eukprot:5697055-Prymnesium_polylepis.1
MPTPAAQSPRADAFAADPSCKRTRLRDFSRWGAAQSRASCRTYGTCHPGGSGRRGGHGLDVAFHYPRWTIAL